VGVFYLRPQVDSTDPDNEQAPHLTAEDAEAIMQMGAAPAVNTVVIEYSGNGVISAGGDRYIFGIKGVTPNHFVVTENELGAGRYYTPQEERSRSRVVVLGRNVAETLFGTMQDAIGERVTLRGVMLEVVGVVTTKSSGANHAVGRFGDPEEQIYLPYQTARTRLFRNQVNARVDVSTLTVQALSPDHVPEAIDQVTALLRERHRLAGYQVNDFTIQDPKQAAEQMAAIMIGFNGFLSIVAGISLLVGGIGIMNIMLVSVTERTREIGLRKAVGARRRDIMLQFLIESLVLCLLGGGLGILLGYGLSFAGTFVLANVFRAEEAQATVTLSSVTLAVVISAGVGIFFGFYPALRASRLHPIAALRYE
jgi:putative ABC transport system permease protein